MSAPAYIWRPGFYPKADPNKVGKELQALAKEHDGEVAPKVFVEFADKHKSSASYTLFEWDDKEAAKEHRLEQARLAMRSLIVINLEVGGVKQEPIRAFVNIGSGNERAYAPITAAMRDPETREQILDRAWEELEAWRRRHAALQELASAFAAVDRLLAHRKRKPGDRDNPRVDAD